VDTTARLHETLAESERLLLLGSLALGLFWAIGISFGTMAVGLLGAGVLIMGAVLYGGSVSARLAPWATLVYAAIVGVADRLHRTPIIYSDVMNVTQEAIRTLARGQDPYTHTYLSSRPAGTVGFVYPPGEIAFYAIPNAIWGHIQGTDRWAGIGIVLLLAGLALRVGPVPAAIATALYGTFSAASFRALDGSNDTGLGLLVVLAVALLAMSERGGRGSRALFYASAIAFAWALLFKQFAWFLYPFVAAYLWRRDSEWLHYVGVSLAVVVLAVVPFLLMAPLDFVHDVLVGGATYHKNVWGVNIWAALEPDAPRVIHALAPYLVVVPVLAVALVMAAVLVRPASNLGFSLFRGLGALFVALYLARWTTPPYYTFAGAVLAAAIALLPYPQWHDLDDERATAAPTRAR
jgi:hypothetical protein